MKNPFEVLKTKEQEIDKVKKEVDALRVTIQLIGDEKSAGIRSEGGPAHPSSKCRRFGSPR